MISPEISMYPFIYVALGLMGCNAFRFASLNLPDPATLFPVEGCA
jgi:hypothetical protein